MIILIMKILWLIINEWNGLPIWLDIQCDINIARQRCIDRDKSRKPGELWVPVEIFDMKLNQFEPMKDYPKEFNPRLTFHTDI